jgi:regulator of protease activity HflC (stomatin/prohibitin superfamily)
MIKEFDFPSLPGLGMLVLTLCIMCLSLYGIIYFVRSEEVNAAMVFALAVLLIGNFIAMGGLFSVAPNQSVVLTLFGEYKGSVRKPGLHWVNPFLAKQKVSLRVHNFETQHLKVNDHDGNPIEIGAVVVWKVFDAAEAVFEVESYENYVKVQCESALRNLATAFPYDAHNEGQMSLRGNSAEIIAQLKTEIEDRLGRAGVQVIESRISHLAYAPEIATAMLQRQQASAIVAARQKIVEGAVGMVEMALEMIGRKGIVELDAERKAAMVSNLLVVLCGERGTQPVVNTGTIYH